MKSFDKQRGLDYINEKFRQTFKSKYGGIYGLHDLLWVPKDERQNELFKGEENG